MNETRIRKIVGTYRKFMIYSLPGVGPCFWGELKTGSGKYVTEATDSIHGVKADILEYWELRR